VKITHENTDHTIEGTLGTIHGQRIVIEIEPEDDPQGNLSGLVWRGRLEAWLRRYGKPQQDPADADEAWDTLVRFAFAANMTEGRYDELLWTCRDTVGMSWGRMTLACDGLPKTTIRRRVAKIREQYANEHHMWRDRGGLHKGTAAEAAAHLAAAVGRDGAEATGPAPAGGNTINVFGIVNNYPEG